ncbi:hypothetical protein ABE494_15700 [Stenotrophomonas lactitubi]|uniref:hypothetical protein n=1 Tax=Stenotrophomonas TaxID=40323 RepID=UPI000D38042F|nr:hypothetical protein [Stenotrophomonas sp. HMWF023]PTS77757.1 hypothetical protein DBR20_07390 [Stenotrophomonas sp. HMWF023]PTT37012.1 hypothetical protein DBR33_18690 [Stenotrophomonas sp. HMWF022]
MGWFTNAVAATTRFVSTAAQKVASAAQKTWEVVKKTAVKVVTLVATDGEKTVAKAKDLWKTARPYVKQATAWLRTVAPHPLIKNVALAIDTLLALENSPVLHWIDKAVTWTIELAKRLNAAMEKGVQVELDAAERAQAEQYQQKFRDAAGSFSGEQAHAVSVVAMVNDLVLAQDRINALVETGEVADVDHFLRLRATQKLLKEANARLAAATESRIDTDDIFLVRVASDLLNADPSLSSEDAQALDDLLQRRHGRGLLPFAFEEMLPAWHMRNQALEAQWEAMNDTLPARQVKLRRLEAELSISADGRLDEADQAELDVLRLSVPLEQKAFDDLADEKLALSQYLHAAEGFLQVLERPAEELEAAGMGYLIDAGQQVGELIIQGAEQGKQWNEFTPRQQELIIDFANIFEDECLERVQRLVEVAA